MIIACIVNESDVLRRIHASPNCSQVGSKGARVYDTWSARHKGFILTCRCWHSMGYLVGDAS